MTHTTESLMERLRATLSWLPGTQIVIDTMQEAAAALEARDRRIAQLVAERDALDKDAARLDWMQFHGAQVCWGSDDEVCDVRWDDRDDSYKTKLFYDWREAIDAARKGEIA